MRQIFIVILLIASLNINAQNVGINTTDPQYPLDVNGRMRLKQTGVFFPGIWFNKPDNNLASFLGQANDSLFGLYDATENTFKFYLDHKNGNLSFTNSNKGIIL